MAHFLALCFARIHPDMLSQTCYKSSHQVARESQSIDTIYIDFLVGI